MSLSDINALREYIQNELSKVAVFMKATNNSIGAMQDTDSLLLDKFNKLTSAVEDLTTQLTLQQRQIRELTSILRQLVLPEYFQKLLEPHSQSEPEQDPERLDKELSLPSSDEQAIRGEVRHDPDSDEVDGSGR